MAANMIDYYRVSVDSIPPEERVELAWHDLGSVDWEPLESTPELQWHLFPRLADMSATREAHLQTLLEQELTQATAGWER